MFDPMSLSPLEAYRLGFAEELAGLHDGDRVWRRILDNRDAVASWRKASRDHAETSYYGADRIRAMRAYWIGRSRGARYLASLELLRNDLRAHLACVKREELELEHGRGVPSSLHRYAHGLELAASDLEELARGYRGSSSSPLPADTGRGLLCSSC